MDKTVLDHDECERACLLIHNGLISDRCWKNYTKGYHPAQYTLLDILSNDFSTVEISRSIGLSVDYEPIFIRSHYPGLKE